MNKLTSRASATAYVLEEVIRCVQRRGELCLSVGGNRKVKDHEMVRVQIESHATLFEREKQVHSKQSRKEMKVVYQS